jgi:uncharacterized protein
MHRLKKLFHLVLGIILIALGLAGLILPVLNGTILLVLGFILLSFESTYVEYHLHRIAHKNTKVGEWYEKLRTWMRRVFRQD